jgi:cardiolipin synthase
MKLLIQPEDGVQPLIRGIARARHSVQVAIFRFDQREMEHALASAVSRGVSVSALIANTNRAGDEGLRQLEMRLLSAGVTVARTADDLVRYHGKWMVVDGKELYVMAFNLTHHDIDRCRSFGVITSSRDLVREAANLFEADTKRHPYQPGVDQFVVSPANARKQLAAFIRGATRDLAIYDPRVSDRAMIRLLEERARSGVRVRLIGRLLGRAAGVEVHKLPNLRLHTRAMVRDGKLAFLGSQSLREAELDARREVGLLFRDRNTTLKLSEAFERDWAGAVRAAGETAAATGAPTEKIAKKVAKAVARDLPPVAPLVNGAVAEAVGRLGDADLVPSEVEQLVKGAVKEAVREVVRDVVEEVVERSGEED